MEKDGKQKQIKLEQGSRLTAARIDAGFVKSRAQAAKEAKWSISTLGAHETGTRTIGLDDAERYARFYASKGANVTAVEILCGPPKQAKITPNESDVRANLSWERLAPMIDAAIQSLLDAPILTGILSRDHRRLMASAGVRAVSEALEEPPSQLVAQNQEDEDRKTIEILIRQAARKGFVRQSGKKP
jgi:hypothetical protein